MNKGIIMGDFNTPLSNDEKLGGMALDLDSKLDLSNFINILALWIWISWERGSLGLLGT